MNSSAKFELTEFCTLRVKYGFEEACEIFRERMNIRRSRANHPQVLYPVADFEIWDTPQDKGTRQRCKNCDVEVACLAFAVEMKLPNHVYGGLNHSERLILEERYDELFGSKAPAIVDEMDLSERESLFWSLLQAQVDEHTILK